MHLYPGVCLRISLSTSSMHFISAVPQIETFFACNTEWLIIQNNNKFTLPVMVDNTKCSHSAYIAVLIHIRLHNSNGLTERETLERDQTRKILEQIIENE